MDLGFYPGFLQPPKEHWISDPNPQHWLKRSQFWESGRIWNWTASPIMIRNDLNCQIRNRNQSNRLHNTRILNMCSCLLAPTSLVRVEDLGRGEEVGDAEASNLGQVDAVPQVLLQLRGRGKLLFDTVWQRVQRVKLKNAGFESFYRWSVNYLGQYGK